MGGRARTARRARQPTPFGLSVAEKRCVLCGHETRFTLDDVPYCGPPIGGSCPPLVEEIPEAEPMWMPAPEIGDYEEPAPYVHADLPPNDPEPEPEPEPEPVAVVATTRGRRRASTRTRTKK